MAVGINRGVFRELSFLALAAGAILSLLVLICIAASDYRYSVTGRGFVCFTCVTTLIITVAFLVIYLLNIPATFIRVPWVLMVLIYSVAFTLFYLISFIISAVASAKWHNNYNIKTGKSINIHACLGAAAFFCILATIVYGVLLFLFFQKYRASGPSGGPAATTHTATVTETRTTTTY